MNSRQRVKASINFEIPDRIACNDNIWPDTLANWRQQGMSENVSIEDYFQYDISSMFIDCSPRYEQKILDKDGVWYVYQDRYGYSAKKKYGKSSSMHFFDHKTKDKNIWQSTRNLWLLDKQDAARIDKASIFEHFDPYPTWNQAFEQYKQIYATGRYMHFVSYGPWEATWRHCGYESLLVNLALEPEWVKEMADTHIDLLISVIKYCLELGMKPDGFFVVEDIAQSKNLLMSPAIWRSVLKPGLKKLGDFLEEYGIDFWMHCCGNIEPLISELIDCNIKVLNPLQVSAGLDALEIRKKFGKKLALYGNIPVASMSGNLQKLEDEIRTKVSLAKLGGYIYHSDHSISPDIDLEQYRWILDTVRKYGS